LQSLLAVFGLGLKRVMIHLSARWTTATEAGKGNASYMLLMTRWFGSHESASAFS
jgi:hypothetical protein